VKALIVGHAEPAAALTSALGEAGLDAQLHAVPGGAGGRDVDSLATSMVELERLMVADEMEIAVAVGLGDGPLALTLNAAKLGVLVAWVNDERPPPGETDAAETRIITQLAGLETGTAEKGDPPREVAQRIRDWADLHLAR